MPAPPLTNNFDGGTDGVTITAANSGGASGNAFNDVGLNTNDPVYSLTNARAILGAKCVSTNTDLSYVAWTGLGSLTVNVYLRCYLYISTLSFTSGVFPIAWRSAAPADGGFLRIVTATGKLQMRNAAGSQIGSDSSGAVSAGKVVRLEARYLASTTVGEIEYRYFDDPNSTTATFSDSATGAVLAANCDIVRFGLTNTPASGDTILYYDDLAVATTGWIGPVGLNTTPIAWLHI